MAESVEIEIGLRITATIMRSVTWLGIGQVCSEVYGYGFISPVWYFFVWKFYIGFKIFWCSITLFLYNFVLQRNYIFSSIKMI